VRGNVCGGPSGQCGVNERAACCDCPGDPKKCCKQDSIGIYRCFGGGSQACPSGYDSKDPNCCIKAGDRCQFTAECCDGTPCVPDAQGVLRCLAKPPGGIACVMGDGACTATADCCAGLTCNITPGRTYGSCAAPPSPPPPPPPPPADAGTDSGTPGTDASTPPVDAPPDTAPPVDAPTVCAFIGQGCSASVNCCTGYLCAVAGTRTPCGGASNCTCTQVID
jgi:hypothetical protein